MTLRITTALLLTVTISLYYFLIVVVGRWPSSTPSPAASTDSRKKEDASLGHNDRQNTPYDPADSPRLLQEGQDDLQGINKNILVLSSTGRGGSSFLGQLITSMGATFFISEPLTPFVRRQVPLTKAMALSELRSNFLCNITESLAKSKVRYRQSSGCSQLHPLKATDTRGLTEWSQVCQTSAVRVVKTIYCRLEWITELLKDPLVKVKVVHLVRDPRAVRQSMKEARWPPSKMAICPAIMEDLQQKEYLEQHFPQRYFFLNNAFRSTMAAAGVLEEAWDEKLVKDYLQKAAKVTPPPRVDHKQFIEASNKFPVKFPTQTARVQTHVKNGKDVKKLTEHINTARPVLHHRCLPLFASFLHHKRTYGTSTEKAVYDGMDMVGLVDRLLHKRPITFFGRLDQYLLRDTTQSKGGFQKIGTDQETPPLCLADYLSYDEIKLSALLSVSSPSFFINDGNRKNKGVPGAPGSYQEEGVVVGMVGARLKKAGFMEWQDCVVSRDQNTREGGYGGVGEPPHLQHLWSHMWRTTLPVWDKVSTRSEEFFKFGRENYVNVPVYKARIQLTAETLLAEAKSRAMSAGLKAYIHVVGLGLGVWRACHEQDAMFVDAWGAALQACDTSQVAHVDFSWIGADQCQGVGDGEVFPDTGVVIHFSKRSLHDHVPKGTLLVVSYAWDGNAFPGNEYWIGKLASTGDGAAACSTGVAELHNSHINANVCGTNLHVAGPWGVMHVGEYASRALSKLPSHKKLKITPE